MKASTTNSETWYQRSKMTLGKFGSLYMILDSIAGDVVFGKNKGKTKSAYDLLCNYMEKSEGMDCFKIVSPGNIIIKPPTDEEMIIKLVNYTNRAREYYRNEPFTMVTDLWAQGDIHDGMPLNKNIPHHARFLQRNEKRFSGKMASPAEQMVDLISSSSGMLCEGHVIAYLNTFFTCLECRVLGQIGWCEGISHRSVDGFRDAICMNCLKSGINTLFEIKTRWESAIIKHKDHGTYAGSFAAINALMMIKANVYLVIASRDTGDVRVGKITSSKLRGNKNWLYALQEGFEWGAPSSYVSCAGGLILLQNKMPPLIDIDKRIKSVIHHVLSLETSR